MNEYHFNFYIKPVCRLVLIVVFLISSISITLTWTSVLSASCLVASYILFKTKPAGKKPKSEGETTQKFIFRNWDFVNPFKGKTGKKFDNTEAEKKFNLAIDHYLLYDAAETKSVKNFESMKTQSDCVFAKRSQVWGSPEYDEAVSLEENIKSIYPTFLKFISCIQSCGVDAFIVELPGHLYGENLKVFGDAVRRTLLTLKECDNIRRHRKLRRLYPSTTPLSLDPEDTSTWSKKRWVYEIHTHTFFITTFAPFYPETNSRYSFGLRDCYILFQPELSFAIHDLPPDTPTTNWLHPVSVRDKIRKAFYDKGREYTAPMVANEPMVYDIVKRIEPGDEETTWWLDESQTEMDHNADEEYL